MAPRKKIKPASVPEKKPVAKKKRTTLDILNEWTQRGLYIYLRAVTSKYEYPNEPHRLLWKVKVEYRNVNWFQHEAESETTPDAAIHELDKIVPKVAKHVGGSSAGDVAAGKPRKKKASHRTGDAGPGRRKKKGEHRRAGN